MVALASNVYGLVKARNIYQSSIKIKDKKDSIKIISFECINIAKGALAYFTLYSAYARFSSHPYKAVLAFAGAFYISPLASIELIVVTSLWKANCHLGVASILQRGLLQKPIKRENDILSSMNQEMLEISKNTAKLIGFVGAIFVSAMGAAKLIELKEDDNFLPSLLNFDKHALSLAEKISNSIFSDR